MAELVKPKVSRNRLIILNYLFCRVYTSYWGKKKTHPLASTYRLFFMQDSIKKNNLHIYLMDVEIQLNGRNKNKSDQLDPHN